jgi:oligopeptide/dipeptide ABC transporter ATP-binding protein
MSDPALLRVDRLEVTHRESVKLVCDASFSVSPGQVFGIVGESGSGKSMTLRAILGLLPPGVVVSAGEIELRGRPWSGVAGPNGREIGFVPQEPLTALNPVYRVGRQVSEAPRALLGMGRKEAERNTLSMLERVGLDEPERVAGCYPHELSGGMRQRVVIAMALACSPGLLLCDEPTTALDVLVQSRLLDLLRSLAAEAQVGIVIVTHDLGVVARSCDEVAVMYAGRVVEQGRAQDVLSAPRHPYTAALCESLPAGDDVDQLATLPGAPPDPAQRPSGCAFNPRCRFALPRCLEAVPPSRSAGPGRTSACIRAAEMAGQAMPDEPGRRDG